MDNLHPRGNQWSLLLKYYDRKSDATKQSIFLESSITLMEASFTVLKMSFVMLIGQASLMIVTYYNHYLRVVQATLYSF